jgi:hypothetical protein
MTLRSAFCAVLASVACCLGCQQTAGLRQGQSTAQAPATSQQPSQFAGAAESQTFITQTSDRFFAKPSDNGGDGGSR